MNKKKTILITGASSGIGLACTKKFISSGWQVILIARRQEILEAIHAEFGQDTIYFPIDISNVVLLEESIKKIPKKFREIDVLLNNAGVSLGEGPIEERLIEDSKKMIEVNILGLISCTHLIIKGMVSRNKGHIINIGSTAGSYPRPGNPIYCASKAFVKQFALSLRADLASTSIRVTNIEPGTVQETELALGRLGGNTDKLKKLFDGYDYLLPEDIAECVFWVSTLPERVNINRIDLMAQCQTFSNLTNRKNR